MQDEAEAILVRMLARCQDKGPGQEAVSRALREAGGLVSLAAMRPQTMTEYFGVPKEWARLIWMLSELTRVREASKLGDSPALDSEQAAERCLRSLYMGLQEERLYLLLVNKRRQLKKRLLISTGTLRRTALRIRVIAQQVLSNAPDGVILCHNHPGGTGSFSRADIDATLTLNELMNYLQVTLVDHLLYTEQTICSMRADPDCMIQWARGGMAVPERGWFPQRTPIAGDRKNYAE